MSTAPSKGTAGGFDVLSWQAPEQAIPGKVVQPTADFWALGLGFRLLTGLPYFRAAHASSREPRDLVREIVLDPVERASGRAASLGRAHLLPAGFDDWFAGCVARSPEARFSRAAELGAMFDAIARRSGGARRANSQRSPEPVTRCWPRAFAGIAARCRPC